MGMFAKGLLMSDQISFSKEKSKMWLVIIYDDLTDFRSNHPVAFLGKVVLKISSKFTGEHPCRFFFKYKNSLILH